FFFSSRRRHTRLQGDWSSDVCSSDLAERSAINSVVQGSAADLIKIAMVNIHRRLKKERRPSKLLLQVHDELVFETPEANVETERSEERRVGKECRYGRSREVYANTSE